MGQTSRLQLPFPDGSDAVMNGDDAMAALAAAIEALLPRAGDYKPSAQQADHGPWLLCDGRNSIPRTSVSTDFVSAMLAAGFPGSDGSHIGVPDFRGRAIIGKGTHADVDALSDNEGTALGNRRPKHKHDVSQTPHNHLGHDQGFLYHSGSPTGLFLRTTIEGDTRHIGMDVSTEFAIATFSVGPQTNVPTDGPAYQVANVFVFAGMP